MTPTIHLSRRFLRSLYPALLLATTSVAAGTAAANAPGTGTESKPPAPVPAAQPAPQPATAEPDPPASHSSTDTDELIAHTDSRLAALSAQMGELKKMLAAQQKTLSDQQDLITAQAEQIEAQKVALSGFNAQLSQIQQTAKDTLQAGDSQLDQRLDYLEQKVSEQPDDPLAAMADTTFPGSWRLPGTNAAMRIGGYVKMNIINSFDPLVTRDRFIVGTIPPDGTNLDNAEEGASLTAQQSRVNLDLRDHTDYGMLRAFVEGDFAGDGETFRMRHAYGQFSSLLAGKTWSTLVDVNTKPEEIDFEGINGMINVRQPQLRFFPSIGKNLNLRLGLEDPSPDVSGGTGSSSGIWDLIASLDWTDTELVKGTFLQNWSMRTGLIGRQIRARGITDDTKSTLGWGLTFSGQIPIKRWNENDKVLWQITAGEGIGRYINDLGTVGGQDAIFAPDGSLDALPVFAGYLSVQHWWSPRWRSNATFSWVDVDPYDYQNTAEYLARFGSPYERTLRASANVLFTPVRRLEIGAEMLWGERRNGDGTKGDASQIQVSARYLY